MPRTNIARRSVMVAAGTGTLAALGGVFYGSKSAKAVDIGVTQLSIEDQTLSSAGAPDSIMLAIDGDYRVDSNVAPDELRIRPVCEVDGSVMGAHEFPTQAWALDGKDASDTFAFSVDLLALSALRDAFPGSEGESNSRTIKVTLEAEVVAGADVIGTAQAAETFVLELTHEAASAKLGISATGSVGE